MRLSSTAPHLKQAHQNENSEENKQDWSPRYVYVIQLCHQQTKAGENYYQPNEYSPDGSASSWKTFPFIPPMSHVTPAFAACTIKRCTAINANCSVVCIVSAAFSTVNYTLSLHNELSYIANTHKTFGTALPHNSKCG